MSIVVKERLRESGLLHLTTHEDRVEIDRMIEEITGMYCDEGVKVLSESEFLEIVESIIRRRKKKKAERTVEVV
ncbi:MAG TPA: hypothetical protein EYP30_07665 [Archaeoglobaceae archaeon]|nr:hypothetical protein [Archaeoglobaceae archaeon]